MALLVAPSMAAAICGDSLVDCSENCDDGNTAVGDGCNQYCRVEYGFVCPAVPSPADYSPFHVWPLDDLMGTVATATYGGNNGAYGGGPTLGSPGAVAGGTGTSVAFDGIDDYVAIPHVSDYRIDEGTIAFWFNADKVPSGTDPTVGLFSKDHNNLGTGGHLSVYLRNQQIRYRLQVATQGLLADGAACTSPTECSGGQCLYDATDMRDECDGASNFIYGPNPSAGIWYHVTVSFGAQGMKLYMNGTLVGSNPYVGGMGINSGGTGNAEPIALGASTINSNPGTVTPLQGFFDGRMDEVYFFNYQLTDGDVAGFLGAGSCSSPGGACSPGAPAGCGDSVLDPYFEECDDGNTVDGDGCNALCIIENCGDSLINDTSEVCDDGNRDGGDGCGTSCTVEDGYSCAGEPSVCTALWTCGNGMVELGELCDDPATCSVDCQRLLTCGDGVIDPGELCDDYNIDSGDGCDASCQIETGFTCAEATASSYWIHPLYPSVCNTTCGDGIMVGWEACDDGNVITGDGCDERCQIETCGDGFVRGAEACDDGGTTGGDGCSDICQLEVGYVCPNGAGRCVPETTCDSTTSYVDTKGGISHNDTFACPWNETLDANGDLVLDCADGQTIAKHQNIPPFDVVAGDTRFFLDAVTVSPTAVVGTIEMAVASSNGASDPGGPWTTIVTMGAATTNGNTTFGDFDLEFLADANWSFPGGGLLIRFTPISGTLVTTHGHGSGQTTYTYLDYDGVYPWDVTQTSYGIPFRLLTGTPVCEPLNYGFCNPGTLLCQPIPQDFPRTTVWCGPDGGSATNCELLDYFSYSISTRSEPDGASCGTVRLNRYDRICSSSGSCSTSGTYYTFQDRFCEHCDDEDPCTSTSFSGYSGCTYSATGDQTCWDGDPGKRNVGSCSDGIDYCRNPGPDCVGASYGSSEVCDGIDNDCSSVIDEPAVTDPLCADADPLTTDQCTAGVCTNIQYCPNTDTSCGLAVPCLDCTALSGWVANGNQGPCCTGLDSCTCDEYELRTYYCGGAFACEYILEPVSPTYQIVPGTCATCDDSNICTNDSCNAGTGVCENVDSGYSGACYTGPGGTEGIGICEGGTEMCVAGTLGACSDVVPASELCNNLDDDCNGTVDDNDANISCTLAMQSCWSGQCDDDCTSDADCAPATEICYFENGSSQVEQLSAAVVLAGFTYYFKLNGTTIGVLSGGAPTAASIANDLAALVNALGTDVVATVLGDQVHLTSSVGPFTLTDVDANLTRTTLVPYGPIMPGRCAPIGDPCADVVCPGNKLCYEGSCTNDDCQDNGNCNVYSECYDSGRCLNDPGDRCNGVQCPQGEACVQGSCKKPCNDNSDCSAGNKCVQNFCFPEPDPCDGIDCKISEACYQGTCYEQCAVDADCLAPGDVCYDASRCGPATDPCFGVNCPSDEFCYQGACFPQCGVTPDCTDPGDLCYDVSYCAVDACENVQCPQNEACQGGVCYLICASDIDCASISPAHACWGGYCKLSPCDDVNCGTDQVCSGGACYYTCVDDADCTIYNPGHACYGGLCTDDPCADVLCGDGQTCWGGSCYDICAMTDDCDPSVPICWDAGFCGTTDPCAGVACASTEICYGGSCYEDCSATMACADPNDICWDATYCAPGPCSNVLCPVDEFCFGGSCFQACTMDADCLDPSHACYNGHCAVSACDGIQCGPAEVCYEGTCYQSCNGTVDCSDPADICYDNLCQDPCDTITCGASETCYLGTCYEYCNADADCSDPNSICYDNRCVDAEDPWCDGVNCPMGESCYRGTCYEYCTADGDCSDPNSICYDNACVPTNCGSTFCDTGEVCYNGVCYEDCSDGTCDDPTDICYDNMRCAASACEAMAQNVIDDYDDNHVFHKAGRRLHAIQLASLPWLWPRPYSDAGVDFDTWADVASGSAVSSDNDALYAKGAARVAMFYDDNDETYVLYLIHGSKDASQGPAAATYSVRVRGVNPDVLLMDDRDAEAWSESPDSDGWRHIQAHVTTGASETGGIAIGRFPIGNAGWQLQIAANFSGDVDRWELMNGETGRPLAELTTAETLSIRTSQLAGATEIQPEFGTACNTDQLGICKRGTVTACELHVLTCDQTVFPWNFEVCDGVDNTCNGLVDVDDASLQYPIVESRQNFQRWRPWPTIDEANGVGAWLNYSPASITDDRLGSTDARRMDGSPLQEPGKVIVAMHRDTRSGAFSMPVMTGQQTVDASMLDRWESYSSLNWRVRGLNGTRIEESFVCWYDDRSPAATDDEVLALWDRSNLRADWISEISTEDGSMEADTVAIRPQWLEGVTGRRTHLRIHRRDDEVFERQWRRYAPALSDLGLHRTLRFHARVSAADPEDAYCISDSSTPNGCVVGTYMCTVAGIQCGPPDDDNCRAGCVDSDFDGHILYDPVFCVTGTDCDDLDPQTYPGAPELCDGRDNDCDDLIDLQTTGVCSNGDPTCGPEDCGGLPVCVCPQGAIELPGDPVDTCVCGESLSP